MRTNFVVCLLGVIFALSLAVESLGQSGTWTTRAPMTPRTRLGAGVVDGSIYALGGFFREGGGGILATVQAYDPQTDAWTAKTPISPQRMCMAVGVIDGVIYVAGGSIAGNLDQVVDAYDPQTNTWTRKAPMPTPRCGAVGAVIDGIFYVVGPGAGDPNAGMEAYDPKTDTWTSKAPMPLQGGAAAGGVIDGILYVIGAAPTGVEVQAYDPKTNSWTPKASMPTPRHYMAAGVVNGLLYAVGGFAVRSEYDRPLALATVEAYDPKTNTWTTAPPMPTPRGELAVAVVDDTLYALGGRFPDSSQTYRGANEAFTPFLQVGIDIKPGDSKNTINLKSEGVVGVAIFGSATFDPLSVDPSTVTLAGAPVATRGRGVPMTSQGDFNRDGYLDLLLFFRTQDLKLAPGASEAVLYATTTTGQRIRGADSIRVVPFAPAARSAPPGFPDRRRSALRSRPN